jgi:hypothetical protein
MHGSTLHLAVLSLTSSPSFPPGITNHGYGSMDALSFPSTQPLVLVQGAPGGEARGRAADLTVSQSQTSGSNASNLSYMHGAMTLYISCILRGLRREGRVHACSGLLSKQSLLSPAGGGRRVLTRALPGYSESHCARVCLERE